MPNTKITVLLTGATGFLGSHLLKSLIRAGYQVILLKRSFSNVSRISNFLTKGFVKCYDIDKSDLRVVFSESNVEYIVHCATNYGRIEADPIGIVEANLTLPLKLLLLGIEHDVRSFVNTDTLLDKRICNYSLSKKHFLDWLQVYTDKIQCVNVALEHFYGFGDDDSKFVTKMIKDVVGGVPEIKLTKGEQKRDFIYIDDVVRAFICIIGNIKGLAASYTEYQIGSGNNVSIQEFCQTIKAIAGNTRTNLNFGSIPYRENEIMESSVDVSKLNALGWTPKIGLVEGLTRVIKSEIDAQMRH